MDFLPLASVVSCFARTVVLVMRRFSRPFPALLVAVSLALPLTTSVQPASAAELVDLVVIDSDGNAPTFRVAQVARRDAGTFASRLEMDPSVEVVARVQVPLLDAATDPLRPRQWSIDALNVAEAGTDGTGVVVGVVDSGIADHADLAGRVLARRDFVGIPGTNYHGTNVAGIIAAVAGNGIGIAGVAPGVRLIDARVCSDASCPSDAVANGIVWAVDQGASVINLSLGGSYNEAIAVAVRYAVSRDVVVIAAAGNSACNVYLNAYDGSQGANGNCVASATSDDWPARFAGVVSVAAIESDGTRASYSSYGPSVALGAPTRVLSTNYVQYSDFEGTSAAAPHAAAVAALVRAANPTLDASAVSAVLQSSAARYARQLEHPTWASCGDYDPNLGAWNNCTGYSKTAVPQRMLGGAGFLDAAAATAMARTAASWEAAPAFTPNATGVTVSVDPVAGASSYDVYLDNTVATTLAASAGTAVINGLVAGSTYAVWVVAKNASGATISRTAPALATTQNAALGTPTLTSVSASDDTSIDVSLASVPADAVTLEVVDDQNLPVAGCGIYNSHYFYCYSWRPTVGATYRTRFADLQGNTGALSGPFTGVANASKTLSTPATTFTPLDSGIEVVISPVSGAAAYVIQTIGNVWVSPAGAIIYASSTRPQCTVTTTIRCVYPAENGRSYEARVAADADTNTNNGLNSYFTPTKRLVPQTSGITDVTSLRVLSSTADWVDVTWTTSWVPRSDGTVAFDVYSSQGDGMGASYADGSWFARIPLKTYTGSSVDVSVVGVLWQRTSIGSWWRTSTLQGSTTISVSAPIGPSLGSCSLSTSGAYCDFAAAPDASWLTRYDAELRTAAGSVVADVYGIESAGSLYLTAPLTPAQSYTIAIRSYSYDYDGRSSAWVTQTLTAPGVASPPTTQPPVSTTLPPNPTTTAPLPGTTVPNPPTTSTTLAPTAKVAVSARVSQKTVTLSIKRSTSGCKAVKVTEGRRTLKTATASQSKITLRSQKTGRHVYRVSFTGCTQSVKLTVTVRR